MGIWTDQSVQQLLERMTKLESEVAYLTSELQELKRTHAFKTEPQAVNGTLHIKRK